MRTGPPTCRTPTLRVAREQLDLTDLLRCPTRTGRWFTLHAEHLAGPGRPVSVIIEPSRPVEIAQLIVDAYQLTKRERQIVQLLASGHTRREIARTIALVYRALLGGPQEEDVAVIHGQFRTTWSERRE